MFDECVEGILYTAHASILDHLYLNGHFWKKNASAIHNEIEKQKIKIA